jgi:ATP-dependent Clp protease adaptor protein ClpS
MSTETEVDVKTKLKQPNLYKVVLLNDNFTPMDFVITILIDIFGKSIDEARNLTMIVHEKGKGIAGIYTKEIAEQKVAETQACAGHYGHPLKSKSEPA